MHGTLPAKRTSGSQQPSQARFLLHYVPGIHIPLAPCKDLPQLTITLLHKTHTHTTRA